jgi:Na+/melibiose symporter-like transporter
MVALPAGLIGILRFVFVKETVMIEEHEEKPRLTDVFTLMRKNHYVWIVTLMWLVYSLVTGMGVMSYYFKWSVGNLDLMGTVQAVAIVSLPLLFFFPMIMKKIPMGKLVMFASVFYVISGVMMFLFARNTPLLMLSFVLTGVAALPITYLTDLMMIDCGSYNQHHGFKRMDGTIGAIKGFAGKLGAGLGSAILGVMLSASGYDGLLEVQPDSAIAMINVAQGLIPAVLFAILALIMMGYKLDLLMPKINKELEEKTAKA